MKILIAGGGIGGLGAALALAQRGHTVRVFERTTEFREIGAGIQLGPNVFKMFDRLGVRAEMLALAAMPRALVMRCAIHGHEITRVPLGEGFEARFGQPYAVIHRGDMHGVLLRACAAHPGVALTTGRAARDYSRIGDQVALYFEDGSSERGDLLIGADGLWSRIRTAMLGAEKPVVSGHIAYRAVLPMEAVPQGIPRDEVVLHAGPRLHLVHYPLRRGELMNLVAVFHSAEYSEGWDEAGDPALLQRHFARTRPEVRAMLEKIETWKYWVLCDREPKRGWQDGRAVLLGDAAHPMLQYLAQGANMALEDALCLTDMLAALPVEAALPAYEAARVLRTGRVQSMARLYGDIYHAADVRAELRDAMLTGRPAEAAWEGMAWLYDGPDWQAP
ncbi:3-hydroxybenzoate 6-monooxygenase [Sediminicoccus sp. KRV36]|uniref:3-hydroxybenzoate 6-monooxygenase n=1 Tax=Sediminicoccus sp. KRV36 TaxID=3133721 RepID=UPI00200C3EA7|nr:3-hydroxybenzoate 6-monooxygenase [Sediminicoccus rosea]UPY38561.1 3-hydroxybenzoate 6-monooxygenase [Sediminicoccus rosea]